MSVIASSVLAVGFALAVFIPAASAHRAGVLSPRATTTSPYEETTTGITYYPAPTTTVKKLTGKFSTSQKKTVATISFTFGQPVTAFTVGLPKGFSLTSTKFAKVGKDLALKTSANKKLGVKFLKLKGQSIALALKTVYERFKVVFNTKVLKLTKSEAKLVKRGKVKTFTLAFVFVDTARQTESIKVKLKI
jgi:hypothetical protein